MEVFTYSGQLTVCGQDNPVIYSPSWLALYTRHLIIKLRETIALIIRHPAGGIALHLIAEGTYSRGRGFCCGTALRLVFSLSG